MCLWSYAARCAFELGRDHWRMTEAGFVIVRLWGDWRRGHVCAADTHQCLSRDPRHGLASSVMRTLRHLSDLWLRLGAA